MDATPAPNPEVRQQSDTYQVHLPMFEGPFDLLLFFIQRDELDIRDIPIHRITHDFLDYLHTARTLQFNLAAEFIVVAAQLMKIKAKMLLPRPVLKEDGSPEDPRQELVDRLLEYQRYKEAMATLERLEDEQIHRYKRGYVAQEAQLIKGEGEPTDELHGLTLYGLLKIYKRVLDKHLTQNTPPRHVIEQYPYRMEDMRTHVLQRVGHTGKLSFTDMVAEQPNRYFVVFSFLVILELLNQRMIGIVVGEGFNNFWLVAAPPEVVATPELPLDAAPTT